jgi:hypothetical protein
MGSAITRRSVRSWVLILVAVLISALGIFPAGASVKPRGTYTNYSYPVLAKDAGVMKGQRVVHTACIFQFDSITGPKDFLAEWTNLGYGDWTDFVNVRLPSAAVGARAFEKDEVTIHGYILGNYSYTTESGGTNTVPNLEVVAVSVVGHNCS